MSVQILTKRKNKNTFNIFSNIIDCNVLKVSNLTINNINLNDFISDVYNKFNILQDENTKLKNIINNLLNINISNINI